MRSYREEKMHMESAARGWWGAKVKKASLLLLSWIFCGHLQAFHYTKIKFNIDIECKLFAQIILGVKLFPECWGSRGSSRSLLVPTLGNNPHSIDLQSFTTNSEPCRNWTLPEHNKRRDRSRHATPSSNICSEPTDLATQTLTRPLLTPNRTPSR